MTSAEFLQQLALHLQCLQEEERENALAYYREYFEEAGSENETDAVERLGSPQSVAQRIISEAGEGSSPEPQKPYTAPQYTAPPMPQNPDRSSVNPGRVVFAIVILLLTCPIWIAVPIVWFSIVLVLLIVPLSFLFSGIAAPVQGILGMVSGDIASGLYDLGGGIFSIGLLMLLWMPCLWLAWKLVKLFGKMCVAIFNLLIGKENRA